MDFYELTMLRAYHQERMTDEAVFSLYYRKLPSSRNYLIAAGLGSVLDFLESFRFSSDELDYLSSLDEFDTDFIDYLSEFRFEGDVWAMPEGTPCFPEEPLLEVVAPLDQAQVIESAVMNQVHFQSVLAAKGSRVVRAAGKRKVVDFGLRRMHGADAAVKAARSFYLAGAGATSNMAAGHVYGIPVTGTMAHSYIQAHSDEREAFRKFVEIYPTTVLLVDTYDTLEGVRNVVRLAGELGDSFQVSAIRLDSGDLLKLARECRVILDEAGLQKVEIFASGGLDEYRIAELVAAGAPISGFGVGTRMGVSEDAPSVDMAYKLTSYGGEGRLKLSTGKQILPGRKQVFRMEKGGRDVKDMLCRFDENQPGRPLLVKVMEAGRKLRETPALEEIRDHCRESLERFPQHVRKLEQAEPPYPVEVSDPLRSYQEKIEEEIV